MLLDWPSQAERKPGEEGATHPGRSTGQKAVPHVKPPSSGGRPVRARAGAKSPATKERATHPGRSAERRAVQHVRPPSSSGRCRRRRHRRRRPLARLERVAAVT